jgi:hypothetical protein
MSSEIHIRIKLISNKDLLPQQWEESVVWPIHKNGDKTNCSYYRSILLLPISYKNFIQHRFLCTNVISKLHYWEYRI